MIDIIAGRKGKGKTKVLLQKVNEDITTTNGTIVYLDKNNKHMYELSNKVRLIVVPEFDIVNADMFIGFIAGILSQDHDLDKIFLDSFLTIAACEENVSYVIEKLEVLSERFDVDFVISASLDKEDLSEEMHKYVSVAL
ncbi:MAG: twitching motility protein PilT [Eubacteriales bacterium]|nr:twitching motility protein PilT [Eubacteriales bacterium]